MSSSLQEGRWPDGKEALSVPQSSARGATDRRDERALSGKRRESTVCMDGMGRASIKRVWIQRMDKDEESDSS